MYFVGFGGFNRLVVEKMLILLDSSEPKEVMSQDAVVALFTLFFKAIALCLLSWF